MEPENGLPFGVMNYDINRAILESKKPRFHITGGPGRAGPSLTEVLNASGDRLIRSMERCEEQLRLQRQTIKEGKVNAHMLCLNRAPAVCYR